MTLLFTGLWYLELWATLFFKTGIYFLMNKSTFTTVLNNAIFNAVKLDFVSKSMMLARRVLFICCCALDFFTFSCLIQKCLLSVCQKAGWKSTVCAGILLSLFSCSHLKHIGFGKDLGPAGSWIVLLKMKCKGPGFWHQLQLSEPPCSVQL